MITLSIGEDGGHKISYILMTEVEMFANILIDNLTIYYEVKLRIKWDIEVVSKPIHITGGIWTRIVLEKA